MVEIVNKKIKVDQSFISSSTVSQIISPVVQRVTLGHGVQKYASDIQSFTKEQVFVLAIDIYSVEVNNGGHYQFFYNPSGVVFPGLVKGLDAVGAKEYLEIAQEAGQRLGCSVGHEREERISQLKKNDLKFNDLDNKYYKLSDTTPLEPILKEYITEHADKFYFEGFVEVMDFDPQQFAKDFWDNFNK